MPPGPGEHAADQEAGAKTRGVGTAIELCNHPEIEAAVLADLLRTALKTLSPIERIAAVKLLPGVAANTAPLSDESPWTVENGGVLASNKLGRKAIERELAPTIRELRTKGIQ